MNLKDQIRQLIASSLKEQFNHEADIISINYTERPEHGDYASPVAMSLAKPLRSNPRAIAEKLQQDLQKQALFDHIDIAGPGYLNFFLSRASVEKELHSILQEKHYGKNDSLAGRNILLEFVSANPTGPLHIGHGRWAAIGDAMARILRYCGADVATEFYINDAGVQIRNLHASVDAVKAGLPVPEDGYHGDYIQEIAHLPGDPVQNLLAMQKETLERFRVRFDLYFSETSLHSASFVQETIEFLRKKGLLYEEEGALWFRTTDFGDDKDRVLIKADGAYTYFAVDIAYHRNKIERRYGELINVFGADHHGYIQRLNAAVKAFSHDVILNIIIGQLVNLYRDGEPVRMSKRTGDMISLDEVIDEIGVDAGRYFLVMRKTDSKLDFDLSIAREQSENNPVFYVQYAHARIQSILRKAEEEKVETGLIPEVFLSDEEARTDSAAWELVKKLISFPELLTDMALSLEPHRMPQYLEDLAGGFHRFYSQYRVISEDRDSTLRRLALIKAVGKILAIGLDLIGVSAPDRM